MWAGMELEWASVVELAVDWACNEREAQGRRTMWGTPGESSQNGAVVIGTGEP